MVCYVAGMLFKHTVVQPYWASFGIYDDAKIVTKKFYVNQKMLHTEIFFQIDLSCFRWPNKESRMSAFDTNLRR